MTKPPGDSGKKLRALLLSPETPFPMIGGGAIRTASIFEYLARHFALDLITFRQPGAPDPRDAMPGGKVEAIRVIDLPYHSKSAHSRVLRNVQRALRSRPPLIDRFSGFEREIADCVAGRTYDVAILEHFWCAQYEAQLRPHCRLLVLDLHNIESAWHRALAQSEPALSLLYGRFGTACERLERSLLPRFDRLLVTSSTDADRIHALAPSAGCSVYPNALPLIPQPPKHERQAIVFSGNLEYQPNISAIHFFQQRIWPALARSFPELIWEIVGKNPQGLAGIAKADPRIRLIGPVDDAIAHIASCQAAVVPLLAGSGTRIKILEAWAAGTPVVSTSIGAEGLSYTAKADILIADTASDFAGAVSSLVGDPRLRARVGDAGRALYECSYVWEGAWAVLEQLI